MDNMVLIPVEIDSAFRNGLVRAAPRAIGQRLHTVLSGSPDLRGRAEAERHFGDKLPEVTERVAMLAKWLDAAFVVHWKQPGLLDWFDKTGWGNDVRLIRIFDDWSTMRITVH